MAARQGANKPYSSDLSRRISFEGRTGRDCGTKGYPAWVQVREKGGDSAGEGEPSIQAGTADGRLLLGTSTQDSAA